MKRTPFLLSATLLLLAGGRAFAAGAADRGPWKPLFNGKNLDGWAVKCKPADKDKKFWRVDHATILADSTGDKTHDYVWLATKNEYDNFVLRLKFQAYRNSPGNSGVQIRSRYDDAAGWLDGPQIDIDPPGPWRTGMIWDETRDNRRWLYPDVPAGVFPTEKQVLPGIKFHYSDDTPAWNELEIRAEGMRLRATVNGAMAMAYNGKGVLDDAVHQKRNVGVKGVIALQIHTHDELKIRFKDVEVQELAK